MILKIFGLALGLLFCLSCKSPVEVVKIEGQNINVNDQLEADTEIEQFITPYREHINNDLDETLAYSADNYSKEDGYLNSALSNFMADVVYEEADPVFFKRSGRHIDFVLMNYGGIRSNMPKGPVSKRTAFELMPFENSVVIAKLPGSYVAQLIDFLATSKRAHPISQLKITLDQDGLLLNSAIKNEAFDPNRTYYVATNDHLLNLGDGMVFFQGTEEVIDLDYKIRNAIIDHFEKNDTIRPVQDDRFIQLKR